MGADRPGRGAGKSWAQMNRSERATTVAIWGMVAALFLSIGVTVFLR